MKQDIEKHISIISDAIDWVGKHKSKEVYEQRFIELVRERSELRKIIEAYSENPAIAAFGASQVGKSYITSSLLQKGSEEFWIRDKYSNEKYNFIKQINPKSNESEATGVVTRLTSYSRDRDRYNEDYPVLLKLFSVADILAVLTIGYFENIPDYQSSKESEVEDFATRIYEKYKDKKDTPNPALDEDGVFNLQLYFQKYLTGTTRFLYESNYFNQVALIVKKVPFNELKDVFSILWAHNVQIVELFERMITILSVLKFAKEVYIPIDAVKNHTFGDNYITLMSVDCLKLLDPSIENKVYTEVLLKDGVVINRIDKSELCAICAEVVFKIDDCFLTEEKQYCGDMLTDYSRTALPKSVKVDILTKCDLLDFPGARAKKEISERDITDKHKNLIEILLRGKVTYLFKKYCDYMAINVLLFCHHTGQPETSNMPQLLEEWVNEYVGDTPQKRKNNIELLDGVSPFFFISTMFNKVMKYDSDYTESTLKGRWIELFEKIYYGQCFLRKHWFDNWDCEGVSFKNTYLLRSYKFSSDTDGSVLYKGYPKEESELMLNKEYYEKLRASFINHEWVSKFFANPTLAWDVAATMQNDGSLYLIQQLSKVAGRSNEARNTQFKEKLEAIIDRVKKILDPYFIRENPLEKLEADINRASHISLELDSVDVEDPYFFGKLIKLLQLSEKEIRREVHAIIESDDLNQAIHGKHFFEAIKLNCKNNGYDIDAVTSEDEKWNCILNTYRHLTDKEQAVKYFESKAINIADMFEPKQKPRLNSTYIADRIRQLWEVKIRSSKQHNILIGGTKFDRSALNDVIEKILMTFNNLNMDAVLANSIAEYVNNPIINIKLERLISSLLASRINRFVLDLGYSIQVETEAANSEYSLDKKDSIETAKKIAKAKKINTFNIICKPQENKCSVDDITSLLSGLNAREESYTPSFNRNYYSWKEYLYIAFITQSSMIDPEDAEANQQMKEIWDRIKC